MLKCDMCDSPGESGEIITDSLGGAFAERAKAAGADPARMPSHINICGACVHKHGGWDETLVVQAVDRIIARLKLP